MHPLEKEILKTIQENRLFEPGEKVVVGVSGGSDSMGLLFLLHSLARELQLFIVVAHLNHGLRPEESKNEEQLVTEQAKKYGLAIELEQVNVLRESKKLKLSVEDCARQLRYSFFDIVLDKHSAHKIAVGHTADDQAEEVLIRLIRGAGLTGLSGMDLIRNQKIVRPFLNVSKEQIKDYLNEKKIHYLTDSSNNDTKYLRNKIRLDLLPYLSEKFNSNINQTLCQTASIVKEDDRFIGSVVENVYHEVVVLTGQENPQLLINIEKLNNLPLAIQRRVLEKGVLQMESKPGFKQIESLVWLAEGRSSGQIHLENGLRASICGEMMLFSYPFGKGRTRKSIYKEKSAEFFLQIDGAGEYLLKGTGKRIIVSILHHVPDKLPEGDGQTENINFDKITFPLVIRNKVPGDRFHPLGAPGSKKVGKFLSDNKIPFLDREKILVLVSKNEIAALLGVRVNHRFRVTSTTRKVLQISTINAAYEEGK